MRFRTGDLQLLGPLVARTDLILHWESRKEKGISVVYGSTITKESLNGGEIPDLSQLRVLLIDNFDSFTYNLYQFMGELGSLVEVVRNNEISLEEVRARKPDRLVISPGPGAPADAGISEKIIRTFAGEIPILGVCLGHQCIGEVFGGLVRGAEEIMHGKISLVNHDGKGLFTGLPSPLKVTRYHSLAIDPKSVPEDLEVTATTSNGVIMGIRHRTFPIEGVQFHPEAILTEGGHALLRNFLEGS